jgi:hypothetical protein
VEQADELPVEAPLVVEALVVVGELVVVGAPVVEALVVEDIPPALLDGVAVVDTTPQDVVLLPGLLAQTQTALAEARTASALPIPQAPITQFAAVAWIAAD